MGWKGAVTRRQFLVWNEWFLLDMDCPTRADVYAMQVACEVRRVLADKPQKIQPKDFRLGFGHLDENGKLTERPGVITDKEVATKKPSPLDTAAKSAAMAAQARWFARVGGKVQIVNQPPNDPAKPASIEIPADS